MVPPLVEYCTKTASGVDPELLISGDSQGEALELIAACRYSKLTVPPLETSISLEVKVRGQAALAIQRKVEPSIEEDPQLDEEKVADEVPAQPLPTVPPLKLLLMAALTTFPIAVSVI